MNATAITQAAAQKLTPAQLRILREIGTGTRRGRAQGTTFDSLIALGLIEREYIGTYPTITDAGRAALVSR